MDNFVNVDISELEVTPGLMESKHLLINNKVRCTDVLGEGEPLDASNAKIDKMISEFSVSETTAELINDGIEYL